MNYNNEEKNLNLAKTENADTSHEELENSTIDTNDLIDNGIKKENENIIRVKAYHKRTLFPKYPKVLGVGENTYGVTVWEIYEEVEGVVQANSQGEITVSGEFYSEIDNGKPYVLVCKETHHQKYGLQYSLIYMNEEVDLSSVLHQKQFLKSFMTDNQISEFYRLYDNPLKIIADGDMEAICKVKGVKEFTAKAILKRFNNVKDLSAVYLKLDTLGLTPTFIKKLLERYGSPEGVVNIIKENPYQLTYDVDGIGFKTADRLALANGLNPKAVNRVKAYINYYMDEEGNLGNSYVTAGELIANIYNEFNGKENIEEKFYDSEGNVTGNNIGTAIQELIEEDKIGLEDAENKSRRRIYLTKYYNLEKNITNNLVRLLNGRGNFYYEGWEEKIKELEKRQGFEFSQEQIDGIKLGLTENVCFISGLAGCVDADTEFFTGSGWKRIADYQPGDKVLQWETSGWTSLVDPIEYIKLPCDYLWHFETKYGLNQTLSNEHRILYKTQKNYLRETRIKDIKDKQESEGNGWTGRFITTFYYNEGKGLNLTDDEIRLMVAIIADGSFTANDTNYCRFHIKKQRKKDRLKLLAQKANIKIIEKDSKAEGYNDYYLYAPRREKYYTKEWYQCNFHQLNIICDEVMYWDGHKSFSKKGVKKASFSTTIKESADFIQFAFSATGQKRASIQILNRVGEKKNINEKEYIRKTLEYEVITTNRKLVGICSDRRPDHTKTKIEKVPTTDGYKYCFTVPSSYLVLRRENCIFITGNSGKSSLVSGILAALDHYSFAQTSLSGKAAARLQEVTGKPGSTIHRLLNYSAGGFYYNRDNPLPYDIIILDEISLVGGDIFLRLIDAIPTGSKLIMLGDMGQLESIGSLNLAMDLYRSPVIPTVELKEVHRQAKKSGILTTAYAVRNQEQLFDSVNYEGVEVRGELQDMILDINLERDKIKDKAIKYYMGYYGSEFVKKDVMNIQLLSPVKTRGETCVHDLNLAIQGLINPINENDEKPKMYIKKKKKSQGAKDESYWLQVGDKVMCIKNNYRAFNSMGVTIPIFNGWTGIIKNIIEDYVIIDFPLAEGDGLIYIEKEEAKNNIILGYASTIHKCVIGDTWIVTKEKGPMKIRDFDENDIGKISVLNSNWYEKPTKFIVNPPYENLIRITAESGRWLTGTADHKVLSYDSRRKKFIFIELKYINVGDWIYVERPNDNKNHLFYRIESVKSIEVLPPEPTYSLEMPLTHLIVENGIICHNCQGSDFPVVIGVLDYNTPPQMLTSQLVYTLLTRAKMRGGLVAQTGALRKAISTDYVSTKRTFLQEFLEDKKDVIYKDKERV